jgi:hypothetical protein
VNDRSKGTGICVLGIFLFVLVAFKVTGNTELSWTWVLSPLWIPLGIVAVLGVVLLFIKAT